MANRKRNIQILFWVSESEMSQIKQKMTEFGTDNLSAYLRKMAINGYIIKLDLPELRELVSLLRINSNNINQLTKKLHQTGRIYNEDIKFICDKQDALWNGVNKILKKLAKL